MDLERLRLLISERVIKDPQAMKDAYIAKNAPSTHEIGWLGHKRFHGTKDRVQVSFDPSDKAMQDKYVYHTHPSESPNQLSAFPSGQDLESAARQANYGLMGSVIFSGPYYTVVVPTERAVNRAVDGRKLSVARYDQALKRGDIEDAIRQLDLMGFDIETGEKDW